jgi:ABC-type antimicrobial peptide transport system permease subunit
MKLLVEAFVVGIATIVVGIIVSFILGRFFSTNLPAICKTWNKNHIMELSLFLTGFFIHLICEFSGVNKWYCKNGVACSK